MFAVWQHITSTGYVSLPVKPKWPSDNIAKLELSEIMSYSFCN